MLRIITQWVEAQSELRRIASRTHDDMILNKEATVREVLQTVKRQGDKALLHYTQEFDHQTLTPEQLRVSGSELDAAYQQVSNGFPSLGFSLQRMMWSWVNATLLLTGRVYMFPEAERLIRVPS
jgi:histidinol dehydrogenase